MSAEILRRAAALMRERAEAAPPGPWQLDDEEWADYRTAYGQEADGQAVLVASRMDDGVAEHIASWHPVVTLAVADWLEDAAAYVAAYRGYTHAEDTPLRVARAYLGDQP